MDVQAGRFEICDQPLDLPGVARLALIDAHSYWVYGYFEETKLPQVHVGDPAEIRLLAGGPSLTGHVESVARGISDRDNPAGSTLLADVNPIFTWVRLAQRVPVRIRLDGVPPDGFLAAGTVKPVVERVVTLAEVPQAMNDLAGGAVRGKIAVVP